MKIKHLFLISLLALSAVFISFQAEAKSQNNSKRPDFVENKIEKAKSKKQETESKAEKDLQEIEEKAKQETEKINKNAQKNYEKANEKVEQMKDKNHKKFDENPSVKAHQKRAKYWWEFWKSNTNN